MVLFCLFLLSLSLTAIFLLSPIVIRYTKETQGELSLHFVFFSLSFCKSSNGDEKKPKRKKAKKKTAAAIVPLSIFRALMLAHPHAEICLYSLPLPPVAAPDRVALLMGSYHALISAFSLPIGRLTSAPLLHAKTNPCATIDCRIKFRTFAFLHTFLIFLAQYRKEKEAKTHGRNENE